MKEEKEAERQVCYMLYVVLAFFFFDFQIEIEIEIEDQI